MARAAHTTTTAAGALNVTVGSHEHGIAIASAMTDAALATSAGARVAAHRRGASGRSVLIGDAFVSARAHVVERIHAAIAQHGAIGILGLGLASARATAQAHAATQ